MMSPYASDAPDTDVLEASSPSGRWREAVVHQLYPRSFADGNGDGMGDLPGIRSRLPYLRELGVDALWLNPFYASPQADAGHDVADHRAVEPVLGTLTDAEELIRDAHGLGMRAIVDLVPDHSSDRHEWFRRAALALRRRHPGLGAGDTVEWDDAPDGVLVFRRPGFVRTTNTADRALTIPPPGRPLLSSSPTGAVEGPPGAAFALPAQTTVWWTA